MSDRKTAASYSPEVRERAVRLVLELQARPQPSPRSSSAPTRTIPPVRESPVLARTLVMSEGTFYRIFGLRSLT